MKARWSGCEIEFDLSGIETMITALNHMNKSPQKAVTKAAREAIKPVLREIKQGTVPVGKTENLKKAMERLGRFVEKCRARKKLAAGL